MIIALALLIIAAIQLLKRPRRAIGVFRGAVSLVCGVVLGASHFVGESFSSTTLLLLSIGFALSFLLVVAQVLVELTRLIQWGARKYAQTKART